MAIDSIGTFDYTTLDSLVAKAKFKLGLRDTSDWDIQLQDAAITGYKRMRVMNGNLIEIQFMAQIDETTFTATLPKGFIRFNRNYPVRFVNENGSVLSGTYNMPVMIGSTFYTESPDVINASQTDVVTIQQVGNRLFFSSNTPTSYVMCAGMIQLRDLSGNIMVPSIFEEFIPSFIAYEWCLSQNDNRWAIFKKEYRVNRQAVKGILQQTSSLDMSLAGYNMNSLV